ncbi:hypothetical protein HPULCUR_007972 [Helicostylum pulchrum]|uniref:DNA 3'-5' helicase n=1 Tax=Helicostylum pulchrum TaxID=562976 RepID=A0ABP9Y8A4_9FUNG
MKTNYAQHLALFQYNVRSNVVSDHDKNARCWHASIRKPVIYHLPILEPCEISSNQNSRKRKRAKRSYVEMEHDSDQDINLSTLSPTLPSTSDETNYIPTRSMSDLSIYYDAENDWINEDDILLLQTNIPPAQPATSSSSSARISRQELETILFASFRTREFIPNQYEAVSAALDNQDMLVVLPTGPPRNICFQLPILFHHIKLTTIVIVPTYINLLEHDDHYTLYHNIPTAFIKNSKKNYKPNWISTRELEYSVIKSYQLVYMTYTDFTKSRYIVDQLVNENLLTRIVIDEAQCISQWGTEFHFGFLRTAEQLKAIYPTVPITALTAISNERIQLDIMNNLSIFGACKIFNKSILL